MNKEQLDKLRANYAKWIVDNSDLSEIRQMVRDSQEERMKDFQEEDYKKEILESYDQNTWEFLKR